MTDLAQLPFSIKCAVCGVVHTATSTDTWTYIAARQAEGWIVPLATDNKPILCPTHAKQ